MVISTTPAVGRRGVRAKEGPKRRETDVTTAVRMRVEVRQMVRACYGGLDGVVTRAVSAGRVAVTWRLVLPSSSAGLRVLTLLRFERPCETGQALTAAAATADVGCVPGIRVRAFSAATVRVVIKEAAIFIPRPMGLRRIAADEGVAGGAILTGARHPAYVPRSRKGSRPA